MPGRQPVSLERQGSLSFNVYGSIGNAVDRPSRILIRSTGLDPIKYAEDPGVGSLTLNLASDLDLEESGTKTGLFLRPVILVGNYVQAIRACYPAGYTKVAGQADINHLGLHPNGEVT
jgi:hypothetical protein